MKTSLPTFSILPRLPGGSKAIGDIGRYVSDNPADGVRRVKVRRRAIRLDGRCMAALRAYRENAALR